jgi:hypothetical protein
MTRQSARATPLRSTLGWFGALNDGNRRRLLSYVAPRQKHAPEMNWFTAAHKPWGKWTDLRCRLVHHPSARNAHVFCTFHESAIAAGGVQPDTGWDFGLTNSGTGWLIANYGSGA